MQMKKENIAPVISYKRIYCMTLLLTLVMMPFFKARCEEPCLMEILSRHGFEGVGVVHTGEIADIYLIYPGKSGKDIERIKVIVGDRKFSAGMLDLLFNNFDQPVQISGFKVDSDPGELSFSYEVLLPPEEGTEEPIVGCSGAGTIKVVEPKRF